MWHSDLCGLEHKATKEKLKVNTELKWHGLCTHVSSQRTQLLVQLASLELWLEFSLKGRLFYWAQLLKLYLIVNFCSMEDQDRFFILKFWLIPWRNWPQPFFFFFSLLVETSDPVATWKNNPLQTFWESTDVSKFVINVMHFGSVVLLFKHSPVVYHINNQTEYFGSTAQCLHCMFPFKITEWNREGWIGQVERDWQNGSLNGSIPFFKDIDVSGTAQLVISPACLVKFTQHQNYYSWTKA